MGDGGGQSSHRRQAVLHPDFSLQAADFGQIVKGVDVADCAPLGHPERGNQDPEGLAITVRRDQIGLLLCAVPIRRGRGSRKIWLTGCIISSSSERSSSFWAAMLARVM